MWSRNVKCGEGTYTYPNQDQYKGEWENDKKNGIGRYYFNENKSKYIGEWKDGKYINGIWKLDNNVIYKGEFKDEKPFGKGMFVFPNNFIQEG